MVHIVRRLNKLRSQFAAAILPCLVVWLVFTSAAQTPATTGVESIRAEELRQKLTYIASDKFKGRGNGTPELDMAAEYIAGVFEKNGLKPVGDRGTYYQHFQIYSSRLGQSNSLRIRGAGDAIFEPKLSADFIPELWSVSGTVNGPLALVEDNRPADSSLKGKIAVEFEDRISSDDPEFPLNATEGRKLEDAGAIGVIIVQSLSDRSRTRIPILAENFRQDLPVRLTAMAEVDVPDYPKIPVVMLSSDVGRQILEEFRKPQGTVTASITVNVERKLHETENVLGLIEGSDPVLRNDVVIVGAHYDHDGEAYGQIWYGADDNGSGTVALLELAEAFGPGSVRPSRSILLSAWAGEEKGLLGSRYYVSHPVFPLNRSTAMFQMDMIGRNEDHPGDRSQQVPEERSQDNINSLNVLGTAFSPDLKTIISRVNNQVGLALHFRYDFAAEDLMRRSDQWSFLQKGIPALFFFAGLHPDYHTPRDTPDKINYAKLEKAARLVYLTAYQLATSQTKPQFVKAVAQKAY
jgi:Peptidase family M28